MNIIRTNIVVPLAEEVRYVSIIKEKNTVKSVVEVLFVNIAK